jgi:hypothetical protein
MRRGLTVMAAVAVLGVALVGLTACGDDAGSGAGTRPPKSCEEAAAAFVGLSKRAAIAEAEAQGRAWRIVREDDEHFAVTFDFQPERLNFEIDDGTVTTATCG